jgi:CHAD domain-containing protein
VPDGRAARRPPSADVPVAVAARELVAVGTTALGRELQAARAGKVEGVHQLRIAIRRLRTALALFERALPRRTARALERELATLGRSVGPVRDLDVLAIAVGTQAGKIDPSLEPAVATILRHVRDRRASAHARLITTLDAPRTRRTMARLTALARRHGADRTPIGTVASELVRPLVRDLVRAARKHDADPSTKAMHRLRIRAKHLRYALEALDGLGGKATRTLVERLAELQRLIGDQRDASTQRAWLLDEVPAFAGDAEALVALGAIAEALRRRAKRRAQRVPRAWRRVDHPKRIAAMLKELAHAEGAARRGPRAKAA